MPKSETIAALSSAAGCGGISVIRVSGPESKKIAKKITNCQLKARYAHHCNFFMTTANKKIDQGIVIFFPQPASFTGEDVIEFHTHGSPVVIDIMLETIVELGARLANPGEFTQRAFLNGKLDLSQAEAVADLIYASTRSAAYSATKSLDGALSRHASDLKDKLIKLRTYVEASLDFSDEEIDFLENAEIVKNIKEIDDVITNLIKSAKHGNLLKEGFKLVFIGAPNVGKSSLMNHFTGEETSIVTEVPGTTRDPITAELQIDGIPIKAIDTAGIRNSKDIVEAEGVRRAWGAIEKADVVLHIFDGTKKWTDIDNAIKKQADKNKKYILIRNKIDLAKKISDDKAITMNVSALTGEGVQGLKKAIKKLVTEAGATEEGVFTARRRHILALQKAKNAVERATQPPMHAEIIAEELRAAQESCSEITGEFTNDDLLGEIFSNFCIGK